MSEWTTHALMHHPLIGLWACAFAAAGFGLAALGCALAKSEQVRQQRDALRAVVRRFYAKEEAFAAELGITRQRLWAFFAGTGVLDVQRLWQLSPEFQAEWQQAIAHARGARVYERDELEFFRGIGRAKLLRMSAVPVTREEGAA